MLGRWPAWWVSHPQWGNPLISLQLSAFFQPIKKMGLALGTIIPCPCLKWILETRKHPPEIPPADHFFPKIGIGGGISLYFQHFPHRDRPILSFPHSHGLARWSASQSPPKRSSCRGRIPQIASWPRDATGHGPTGDNQTGVRLMWGDVRWCRRVGNWTFSRGTECFEWF